MKRKTLLIVHLLFLINFAIAQTDKDFWFVAPEVTSTHNDRPVYLRISTLASPSTVTISQPADPSFSPITVKIPANQTNSVDLTAFITKIENGIPAANVIENKGIHIVSSANINIYYEVLGSNNVGKVLSSDIFTLKGRNALGTKFYTPFQNQLPNSNNALNSNIYGASSFDIVATADNTTITITPSKAIVGHAAGVPFTITLNKGQTYSAKATGLLGTDHLSGSLIVSNKPIAVTTKDDSIVQNNAIDLAGDQLVATNTVGKDYIIVKGFLNTNGVNLGDRAIIVAAADKDSIFIGGVFKVVINAGETYNYQVTGAAEFIRTSQSTYVFHLSGFGDEVGGALLPPIKCTGSRQVAVTRDTDEPFYLNILVKKGGENGFTLNGNTTLIPASAFKAVPGTMVAGEWLYASIKYEPSQVASGSNSLIANTLQDFHLAIINGEATGAGCRYGYFSDYGSTTLKLGNDATICKGQSHTFSIEPGFANVLWSTSSNANSITVSTAGAYFVQGEKGECVGKDTAVLIVNSLPAITEQPLDVTICAEENTYFQSNGNGKDSSFKWQVSTDEGITFTDLAEGGVYRGASTTKLTITAAPVSMNKYKYRFANTGACAPVANSSVVTLQVLDCKVVIPDVFTPFTVDGKNDFFIIKGNEPDSKIEIYNRWGNLIYHTNNYGNDWDGSNATDGVYFYIYTKKKEIEPYKGYVQIIR